MHIQQSLDREIQRVLENNIIEPSESNFINPIVVVKKRNDDIRLCLFMRNSNNVRQKNFYCPPTADSYLGSVKELNTCHD